MAYQGTFAIITAALVSGAVVERMRFGAYLRVPDAVDARRLRAGRALGLGRRLAGPARAPSTSRAGPWSTSTPGRPRWWRRWCWARARTTRGRRCCRTTCPSRCSARACSGSAGSGSTPAARSRPTRRPRSPSSTPCWPRPRRSWSGRCSTCGGRHGPPRWARPPRIVVGLVAITPAAGFVGPDGGRGPGRPRRGPQLLRALVARAHAARRLARRGGRARPGRDGRRAAHGRAGAEGLERRGGRPALRQPAPARGSRPSRVLAAAAYSAVGTFGRPQAGRRSSSRCASARARRASAST